MTSLAFEMVGVLFVRGLTYSVNEGLPFRGVALLLRRRRELLGT